MCDLNQSIKKQVANTVRSLLDRKSSEGLDAFRFFSTQVNLLSIITRVMCKQLLLLCCCLHIKSRSGLYSVLSNIRTGPTDADAFRGHRLTTQKGYTYHKEIKGPRKVNTHAIIGK